MCEVVGEWQGLTGPVDLRPHVDRLLQLAVQASDADLARRLRYRAWLLETGTDESEATQDAPDFLSWEIAKLAGSGR